MNYRRIHFVEAGDGCWVAYFCDTIAYKRIYVEEKECYDLILSGKSEEDYCSGRQNADPALFKRCLNDLTDRGETAPYVPEEKIRLTLNVANSCNMKCGYCYANGGTYHSKENLMTMETAERAVDAFISRFGELGSVKFIGGEPLLNKKVVCGICDYIQKKYDAGLIPQMPDFIIATNGTILDERLIEYSIRYKWRVGLSFDGPESIHELVRQFSDGSPTGTIIKENIRRWKDATGGKCPSSVNACYSGVHQKNGITVTEAVKYMKNELGIEKVNIVPVDASKDSSFALTDNDCFVRAIREILDPESKDYRRYMFTKLKSLEKLLKARRSMPGHICKAGLTTFGVSADGNVSPCHMLTDENEFYMGSVNDAALFAGEHFRAVQSKLKQYDRYQNDKCGRCFANRLCIGCLGGNVFRTGNPYQADPVVCGMIRGALEELLKDITRE